MTQFLVTGAMGFIGSAVVRRLATMGQDVVALTGSRQPQFAHPKVQWLQSDLLSGALPDLSDGEVTHCIHAAWYTHHADYLTHEINRQWVAASLRLADAFAAAGGKRFIGLGTCLEYDVARADGPCMEELTPLRPDTLYAQCKLELFEALRQRAPNFAWARLFFVYGPGDRAGRLIPSMIERFQGGEMAGPTYGGLRRDYIHVEDLAGQLIRIATSEFQGAINTGSGNAPTLSEIYAVGAMAFGRPELALTNDETGDQPPVIQAGLVRFMDEIGDPEARDIATGIRDLLE